MISEPVICAGFFFVPFRNLAEYLENIYDILKSNTKKTEMQCMVLL